jgi:chemotaxis protein CheD
VLTQHPVGLGAIVSSRTSTDVLVAHALGSCIAVCLYDPEVCAGVMAHVVLPEGEGRRQRRPGLHMSTAVPAAIRELAGLGGKKRHMLAGIAGGASMFRPDGDMFAIGRRNTEAAHRVLKELRIPIMLDDTGGELPRSAMLEIGTGVLIVHHVGAVAQHSVPPAAQRHALPRIARLGGGAGVVDSRGMGSSPRTPVDPLYADPRMRPNDSPPER